MKIDFYILEKASFPEALHQACELAEKAFANRQSLYIHTSSQADAEKLDTLLWTFKADSFIPHKLYDPGDSDPPPIQIGCDLTPLSTFDILLNLTREVPPFYGKFDQLIEIVFADPIVQQLARERFRQYRDQGHELTTHKI